MGREFQLLKCACEGTETGNFLQLRFSDGEHRRAAALGEGHAHCWGGGNSREQKVIWVQQKHLPSICYVPLQ